MADFDYDDTKTASGTLDNQDRNRTEYRESLRLGYEIIPNYEAFVRGELNQREYDRTTDNGGSQLLDMSADGRYVAFFSFATNLVGSDTNGTIDIFVKDMQTGAVLNATTDAAGIQANGASADGTISADGRYVAFTSNASNLVLNDLNGGADVFRKDLLTGDVVLVSSDAAGNQASSAFGAKISADGRSILFFSVDDNLTADDGNGYGDIFVKDVASGAIARVATDAVGSIGNDGDPYARGYDFSSDGSQIVFWSAASDLVPGDTNNVPDLFMTANPFF